MKRRNFIAALGGTAAIGPIAARGQTTGKRRLIGVLSDIFIATVGSERTEWRGFLDGLRELGWIDGQTVAFEIRDAKGAYNRLPALAEELVRTNPDAIFATSIDAAVPAHQATKSIPIVSPLLSDPIEKDLAASLARPGGNVTGILIRVDGLLGKQIELARETVPGATTIGHLVNDRSTSAVFQRQGVDEAARGLGVRVLTIGVRDPDELPAAFQSFAQQGAQVVIVEGDTMFGAQSARIASLAIAAHLPTIYRLSASVETGGLISYGVSLTDNYRRAAALMDKVLRGTPAGDIPIEFPTRLQLVINLKTAKALGLTISPMLLARADEVIE